MGERYSNNSLIEPEKLLAINSIIHCSKTKAKVKIAAKIELLVNEEINIPQDNNYRQ